MPYQGTNSRFPTRGGGNSSRFNPYDRSSTDHRLEESQTSFGGYDNREYDRGGAGYRASRRSLSPARYASSRGYHGSDTGGRSYDDQYDEIGSEFNFGTRGRGRGRGRGSGEARVRHTTIRGRGAYRGRGESRGRGGSREFEGYGHDQEHSQGYSRSSEEFYGYPRAPSRFSEAGSYANGGSGRDEEYVVPPFQDPQQRPAEALYESRQDLGRSPYYRQQPEHGARRSFQNDDNMDSGGFRRPMRPSYENEHPSYANEPVSHRPMSQASSRHQPPQQQSRDTGNTDRPGYYKEDIPSASRRFNVRRTVFLRIPYKATSICDSIRSRLAKFGEIADMLELGKKGVCYVMFYDSRDAANAISMLTNNFYVAGEDITIVESRLRPNAFGRCPLPTDYQATVLVSLVGAKRGFEDSDRMYFERYGEVHAFYPYYNSESEWVIEYYDCRSAADAAMNCHGQAACKGTIYTTFLWDDSVPRLEQGPTLASKRLRPEATHDSRVDTRTENNMSFDKATLRSANAAMFIREPRQNDDLYHAREREQAQAPSLQKSPPPMSANDSNRSSVVLPSMAQPLPQPNSAPASTMVPLLPGTKKRPSAAKWMDSAVSSTISRSGSMDAVRKGADQAADLEEVKGGMSPRGEPAPATLASNMNVVLSRLALDPNVEQRARAAREILQQHQGLLGLGKHPAAAPASSSPSSVLDTLPNRPNTVSGATMSGASAVSALNQLVSRAPRHDSQSTMVADISPLIPSKDMSKTLGGLLDYPPSTAALTESASAAANAVRRASRYDPVSLQAVSATSTLLSGFDTESLSATAVSAMASSVSKHGYYAQKQHYQNQERKRPLSIDNSEGVNSLLGILAQVRKNGGTPADTKKR